jgi:hypothetical protein
VDRSIRQDGDHRQQGFIRTAAHAGQQPQRLAAVGRQPVQPGDQKIDDGVAAPTLRNPSGVPGPDGPVAVVAQHLFVHQRAQQLQDVQRIAAGLLQDCVGEIGATLHRFAQDGGDQGGRGIPVDGQQIDPGCRLFRRTGAFAQVRQERAEPRRHVGEVVAVGGDQHQAGRPCLRHGAHEGQRGVVGPLHVVQEQQGRRTGTGEGLQRADQDPLDLQRLLAG